MPLSTFEQTCFLARRFLANHILRFSPHKTGGGESLVTSSGRVVDFQRLALVVPIRLQNETTCTHDILSTKMSTRKWTYKCKLHLKSWWKIVFGCAEGGGGAQNGHCSWFAGPTHLPYFTAPSLHVQSASWNSTELQMPWWRAKL